MLIFGERGKPENLEKNALGQSEETTANSTHIWPQVQNQTWATLVGGEFNCYVPAPHWTIQYDI